MHNPSYRRIDGHWNDSGIQAANEGQDELGAYTESMVAHA
jgi:hypothetical protein